MVMSLQFVHFYDATALTTNRHSKCDEELRDESKALKTLKKNKKNLEKKIQRYLLFIDI